MNTALGYNHVPVLLTEAIDLLVVKPNGTYIDGTLGGGGYTAELLKRSAPSGKVMAFDLDKEAIEHFKTTEVFAKNEKRITLVHGNFRSIGEKVLERSFSGIDGIVADIGMSSFQLDQAGRGISFQKRELLDMRFDETGKLPTAAYLLNTLEEKEIADILWNFGEERQSRKIARDIIKFRQVNKFRFTDDLVEVVKRGLPKPKQHLWADTARRVFQAIRIAVNHELESLELFLPAAFDILSPGGRLAIVSFHSLEDRIVKQFFTKLNKGCICPPDFPACVCGKEPQGKTITKKPIIASVEELARNPRSKPAKLRVLQKI